MSNVQNAVYTVSEAANDTLENLTEVVSYTDVELAHRVADHALVDFVRFLGFSDIADAYEKIPKWYA